jgi:hypothetical protein
MAFSEERKTTTTPIKNKNGMRQQQQQQLIGNIRLVDFEFIHVLKWWETDPLNFK